MLKVASCFSGVGFWEMALNQLKIEHEQVFCVEFDKFPYRSYQAIHGNVKNYGDIAKIQGDEVEDMDLFFYSPPCQAFSVAGKGLGVEEERGVLFFDSLRIIQHKQPRVAIMENVKGLTNKKHAETFRSILACLTMAGYTNYWKVLNTKNYGIPQNRERVFIVSIRNDIDKGFEWPVPFDNGIRLKHLLEDEVEKKFYISEEKSRGLICQIKNKKIVDVKEATKKGYATAHEGDSINLEQPNSKTRRGRVGKQVAQTLTCSCNQAVVEANELNVVGMLEMKGNESIRRVHDPSGLCPTLSTMQGGHRQPKILSKLPLADGQSGISEDLRIRKLTPLECWRLQGATEEDFCKAQAVNSNSQLYKQAGNGVSVNVVKEILKQLRIKGYLEG